jgi:hypothetical protein
MVNISEELSKKEIKQRVSYLKTKGLICSNVSKLRANAPKEMFLDEYKKDIEQLTHYAHNMLREISKANPPKQREIGVSEEQEEIISYIENEAEILIPIEDLVHESGKHLTKKEYGYVLLKHLVIELRKHFSNKQLNIK